MFVRNGWYVAGWAHELDESSMLSRTIANDQIVIFRREDGSLGALEDRCCHRQAPLSLGRIEGNCLRCMYHGLLFDGSGACVEVPGRDDVPAKLRVPAYTAREVRDLIWIWLGDKEPTDTIPDLYWHDRSAWAYRPLHNHLNVDYRLLIDNVLDLSHLAWVHQDTFGTEAAQAITPKLTRTDTGLTQVYRYLNIPIVKMHSQLTNYQGNVDREHIVKWYAPSVATLETTYWKADDDRPHAERPPLLEFRTSHFYTPETETTTNYFWSHFNQAEFGGEEELEKTYKIVERAILHEDVQMISAQQNNMVDDYRMQSVYWDKSAGLARTALERMIKKEQKNEAE